VRDFFRFETNPIVRALTISDIFILSGFGLIAPIFAVFLTENIKGGNVEVAGLASMVYLLAKSIGQIPTARLVDKIPGEKDDFWLMVAGSLATSLVPLLYLIAQMPLHIYLIQLLYGLSQALTFPSWMAIYTRHVDLHQEGTQWGVYYTLVDLTGAAAAAVGGAIAYHLGFGPLFVIVSLSSFIGSVWLLLIRHQIKKRQTLPETLMSYLVHFKKRG
jgi:MFS family permease